MNFFLEKIIFDRVMNLVFFLIFPLLILVSWIPPTPFDVGCWNVHKNFFMRWFKNAFLIFLKFCFVTELSPFLVFLLYNLCKLKKIIAATSLKLERWNLAYRLLSWASKINLFFFFWKKVFLTELWTLIFPYIFFVNFLCHHYCPHRLM